MLRKKNFLVIYNDIPSSLKMSLFKHISSLGPNSREDRLPPRGTELARACCSCAFLTTSCRQTSLNGAELSNLSKCLIWCNLQPWSGACRGPRAHRAKGLRPPMDQKLFSHNRARVGWRGSKHPSLLLNEIAAHDFNLPARSLAQPHQTESHFYYLQPQQSLLLPSVTSIQTSGLSHVLLTVSKSSALPAAASLTSAHI